MPNAARSTIQQSQMPSRTLTTGFSSGSKRNTSTACPTKSWTKISRPTNTPSPSTGGVMDEHEHVWGPLEQSRLAGTFHRKCTVEGCKVINAYDGPENTESGMM